MSKPERMNVRQTPLYQLRGEKTRFRTFENDLTEENPREDLVWAGLRRINYALTLPICLLIIILYYLYDKFKLENWKFS